MCVCVCVRACVRVCVRCRIMVTGQLASNYSNHSRRCGIKVMRITYSYRQTDKSSLTTYTVIDIIVTS